MGIRTNNVNGVENLSSLEDASQAQLLLARTLGRIRGYRSAADGFQSDEGVNSDESDSFYDAVQKLFRNTSIADVFPSEYSETTIKATSTLAGSFSPHQVLNPASTLTGSWDYNCWLAAVNSVTNQRFHIDLGSAKVLVGVTYENNHHIGGVTDSGARNFTLWGSNSADAFADLTYANDAGWTQIVASVSELDIHVSANQADPKTFTVDNSIAYRYYAFKFANGWGSDTYLGIRHIILKAALGGVTVTQSVASELDASPSSARVMVYHNGEEAGLSIFVSRDGGNTFAEAASASTVEDIDGRKWTLSAPIQLADTPEGNELVYKVVTDDRAHLIYGASLIW